MTVLSGGNSLNFKSMFPNLKPVATANGLVSDSKGAIKLHNKQPEKSVSSNARKRKLAPGASTYDKNGCTNVGSSKKQQHALEYQGYERGGHMMDVKDSYPDEIEATPTGHIFPPAGEEEAVVVNEGVISPGLVENHQAVTGQIYQVSDSENENDDGVAYPPITLQMVELYDGMRRPAAVEDLPRPDGLAIADNPLEEFSLQFLISNLNGKPHMNGLYVKKSKGNPPEHSFPHVRSYLILERDHQPLLPMFPGDHGAQITATLEIDRKKLVRCKGMPLFIKMSNEEYKYYGTYREASPPDRLGANEMRREVPEHVKKYWAQIMGAKHKPRWVIDEIRGASTWKFGWLGKNQKTFIDYDEDLEYAYGEPLHYPPSPEKVKAVREDDILEAFENSDTVGKLVLRLFYEYLQCVGYDKDFYEALVAKKHGP